MSTSISVTVKAQDLIRAVLLRIIAGDVPETTRGLCWHVRDSVSALPVEEVVQGWLAVTFYTWPKFSGNIDYPVRSYPSTPKDAYQSRLGFYDTSKAYGRRRLELAQYLLDNLDKLGGLNEHGG